MRQCAKYTLIFLNALLVIGNIALLVCVIIFWNENRGRTSWNNLGIGTAVIFAAISACLVAIKQNASRLLQIGTVLLLVLVIFLLLGAIRLISADSIENINKRKRTALVNAYEARETNSTVRESLDSLQKKHKCCGINGPNGSEVSVGAGLVIDSCCAESPPCTINHAYKVGCLEKKIRSSINDKTFGIVYIVLAGLTLLAGASDCCLAYLIKKEIL